MELENFEGSLILEQLAAIGLVEDFYEAVDADDVGRVVSLLRQAQVDEPTISELLKEL